MSMQDLPYGRRRDDRTDLVDAVEVSTAPPWDSVLERLERLERSHADLVQMVTGIQHALPPSVAAASGTTLALGSPIDPVRNDKLTAYADAPPIVGTAPPLLTGSPATQSSQVYEAPDPWLSPDGGGEEFFGSLDEADRPTPPRRRLLGRRRAAKLAAARIAAEFAAAPPPPAGFTALSASTGALPLPPPPPGFSTDMAEPTPAAGVASVDWSAAEEVALVSSTDLVLDPPDDLPTSFEPTPIQSTYSSFETAPPPPPPPGFGPAPTYAAAPAMSFEQSPPPPPAGYDAQLSAAGEADVAEEASFGAPPPPPPGFGAAPSFATEPSAFAAPAMPADAPPPPPPGFGAASPVGEPLPSLAAMSMPFEAPAPTPDAPPLPPPGFGTRPDAAVSADEFDAPFAPAFTEDAFGLFGDVNQAALAAAAQTNNDESSDPVMPSAMAGSGSRSEPTAIPPITPDFFIRSGRGRR
jgi:hypothetical protein